MICNRHTHFHILDTRVYKSSRIHGRRFTLPVTTRTGLPTPTKLNFFSDFFRSPTIFTLAPSCRKREVTIWRPSVRLSVFFAHRHTHRDSPGGSMRRGQRTFIYGVYGRHKRRR